jgi:hypothetical protein
MNRQERQVRQVPTVLLGELGVLGGLIHFVRSFNSPRLCLLALHDA